MIAGILFVVIIAALVVLISWPTAPADPYAMREDDPDDCEECRQLDAGTYPHELGNLDQSPVDCPACKGEAPNKRCASYDFKSYGSE